MQSHELGNLLERAAIPVLNKLFNHWKYEVLEFRTQKSGTQHGFDIYYKILRDSFALHLLVECKASEKPNNIPVGELLEKFRQADWANFPQKDIHICFSPSRAVKFDNQTLTVEDDSRPFVIMDWMRKETGENLILDLFAAYDGAEKEVADFRQKVLSKAFPALKIFPHSAKTFAEAGLELKKHFDRRIEEHLGKHKHGNFRIINGSFWSEIKRESKLERLEDFYTRADSNLAHLREVVANDLHIQNDNLNNSFERTLNLAVKDKFALIKILSRGGEGKSTFLQHIAKTYYDENTIVWLEKIEPGDLEKIENQIKYFSEELPVIFLLDNIAAHTDKLFDFTEKLSTTFRNRTIVFVTAERDFRYQFIERVNDFEGLFYEQYSISYRSNKIREQVYEKIINIFEKENPFSPELKAEARSVFLEDERKSLSERLFALIKYLKHRNQLQNYRFDWEDWDDITGRKDIRLKELYLILATFYQFGFSLKLDFCASFLEGVTSTAINSFIKENSNLPIYKRGDNLFLRHETIASWFLEDKTNKMNSEIKFKEFLNNINTAFARDIFIWICLKNKDFRKSNLAELVDDSKRIEILTRIIQNNNSELKSRTELSKIYQRQRKWKEAEKPLLEYIELDPEGLHPRTELSKIYQQQRKWKEAENILLELVKIDKDNLQARTELSKIYQRQRKWREAEDILLELLSIDKDNLQARTELSKIYQQQRKWKEAEDILLESLKIDNEQLHPRTELSKIYQRQGRWKEAEDILLELVKIDKDNLQARTELSKIYQQQRKWKEAEKPLLEYIELDPEGLHPRTELSKIYQQQRKWREAEDILLELLSIDKDNLQARTELSKIYQRQRKWKEAEDILLESLKIDSEQLHPRTELSKIYQQQKKWREAEDILLELVKIDKDNLQARTELSKIYQRQRKWKEAEVQLLHCYKIEPNDKHTMLELSRLYKKLEKYSESENLLFKIYGLDSHDIPTLAELSRIFLRFKKYRISISLLEKALEIRPHNLKVISLLVEKFKILKDAGNVEKYLEIGKQILEKDENARYSEQFYTLNSSIDEKIKLLELNKIGIAAKINDNKYIKYEDELYALGEDAVYNYNIKAGDKVFFALYRTKDEKVFADFVEPYFEDISELQSLK
jgi:tetratricopeptide (TPR) repeat protein